MPIYQITFGDQIKCNSACNEFYDILQNAVKDEIQVDIKIVCNP